MTFTESVRICFHKYFEFRGRATRSEFWYFYLFGFLATFSGGFIDAILGWSDSSTGWGPLSAVATLGLMIPVAAAQVRRLHDTGRSGWWLGALILGWIVVIALLLSADASPFIAAASVVALIALMGVGIAVFVFSCLKSESVPNQYDFPSQHPQRQDFDTPAIGTKLQLPENSVGPETDDYQRALEEFESSARSKALYAKLLVDCDGDETKIRARYVAARVQEFSQDRLSDLQCLREGTFESDIVTSGNRMIPIRLLNTGRAAVLVDESYVVYESKNSAIKAIALGNSDKKNIVAIISVSQLDK